jgi:hypothetical protein
VLDVLSVVLLLESIDLLLVPPPPVCIRQRISIVFSEEQDGISDLED